MKKLEKINKKSTSYKRAKKRITITRITATFIIMLMVFLEFCMQIRIINQNVSEASNIFMNVVVGVIADNEVDEDNLLSEIKEEYKIRAKSLAYMFDHSDVDKFDTQALRDRKELSLVDEICVFDETGMIVSSTETNYIGYTLDSGEQMAYFKPMLEDRNLVMCQDLVPNTATNKMMMYAMSWNEDQTYMVQVGIEPKRLLNLMKDTDVSRAMRTIPLYEGYEIVVADIDSGIIKGATDETLINQTIDVIGYDSSSADLKNGFSEYQRDNMSITFTQYKGTEKYIVAIVCDMNVFYRDAHRSIFLVLIVLLIATAVIVNVLKRLFIIGEDRNEQLSVLDSMSQIYYSLHYVDLLSNTVYQYTGTDEVDTQMQKTKGSNAIIMMRNIMENTLTEEYMEEGLAFTNIETIAERMKDKKLLTKDMDSTSIGWFRMSFIAIDVNEDKVPTSLIVAVQDIDEEKKKEFELFEKSNKDALTLCQNRRVYEEEIALHQNTPIEDDFVIAVFDMNGVKAENDTYGHDAGDDMIRDAAEIMRNTFGKHGVVYRMGGDEFVSIIFATESRLEQIESEYNELVSKWVGKHGEKLSISYGIATKREFSDKTVKELHKIADQRMYEKKRAYYETKGNDRRKTRR